MILSNNIIFTERYYSQEVILDNSIKLSRKMDIIPNNYPICLQYFVNDKEVNHWNMVGNEIKINTGNIMNSFQKIYDTVDIIEQSIWKRLFKIYLGSDVFEDIKQHKGRFISVKQGSDISSFKDLDGDMSYHVCFDGEEIGQVIKKISGLFFTIYYLKSSKK